MSDLVSKYRVATFTYMPDMEGVRYTYQFDNGYGASVVSHKRSYGGEHGLWEIAVTHDDGYLCYATPVTGDVLGFIPLHEIPEHLDAIHALPANPYCTHRRSNDE